MSLIYEIVEVDSVCRLCLKQNAALLPLFEGSCSNSSDSVSLPSKISSCVGFEIEYNLDLPQHVCVKCVEEVERWCAFRGVCRESNDALMNAVEERQIFSLTEKSKIISGTPNGSKVEVFLAVNSDLSAKNVDSVNTEKEEVNNDSSQENFKRTSVALTSSEPHTSFECIPEVFPKEEESEQHFVENVVDLYSDDTTETFENCDDVGPGSVQEELDSSEVPWRQMATACPVCRKAFGRYSGVKLHLKVVHTILRFYPCLICAHISLTSTERKSHISKKHPANSLKPNTCRTCGIHIKTKSAFNRHNRHHQAELCCNFCGLAMDSEEVLIEHKKNSHSKELMQEPPSGVDYKFKCHLCDNVSFWKMKDWKEHYLNTHQTQDVYPCNMCSRAYRSAHLLGIHVRRHTGEKPYMCEQCATRFSNKNSLRNHMRKHTTKFQCSECKSAFSSRPSLIYHMRCHTGEKPYICHECGKRFSSSNGLQCHLLAHKGEKPYSCEYCDFKSTAHSGLYAHRVIHSTERPFACEVCGKTFKLKAWMKEHMKTHLGIKNFVCEICNHAFIAKYQLKSHLKTHSGDKPHKCDICLRCFARKDTLSEHMQTHSKQVQINSSPTEFFKDLGF